MKKTLVVIIAAAMVYSLPSCKKETPAKGGKSAEKIKEINDACTTPPTFLGVRTIGGNSHDIGQKVEVAANGDIIVTGIFRNTVDFDPGQGAFNLNAPVRKIGDITYLFGRFRQKLSAAGKFISAEDLGVDLGTDNAAVDVQGNKYVPGSETDEVTEKTKYTVIKLNASGKVLGKVYTDTLNSSTHTNIIHVDNHGYAYVSTPTGKLLKYNTNGSLIWQKSTFHLSMQVNTDAAGNIYIAGLNNGWIEKYNSNGDLLWSVRNGKGYQNIKALNIVVDGSGNVYTLGIFSADADFNPGAGTHVLTSSGSSNVYVQKLTSSGNFVWAVQTQNSPSNAIMPYALALDATAKNIYITGTFTGKLNFNTSGGTSTAQSNGDMDVFVMRLKQCK